MAKTETTEAMELLLTKMFYQSSYCLMHKEVYYNSERCDLMGFTNMNELVCIELKQSVQDFHSNAALTFIGNLNYYAMPYDVYIKVKDEIPKEIGIITLPRENILKKNCAMVIIKGCHHQELKCDRLEIYHNLENSMKANPTQLSDALNLDMMSVQDGYKKDQNIKKWFDEEGVIKRGWWL